MTIRKILDWSQAEAAGEKTGTIASEFKQLYDDQNQWVWCVDVDIGEPEILRNVPIASNNREIYYAEMGKSVALKKTTGGRWVVAGLAKTVRSTTHIIYMSFTDDIVQIVRDETTGYQVRPLTLGELGTLVDGFGLLPLGVWGRFAADGTFIELLGS